MYILFMAICKNCMTDTTHKDSDREDQQNISCFHYSLPHIKHRPLPVWGTRSHPDTMAPVNNNEPTFNPIFNSEIIMTKMVEQETVKISK